MQETKKVIEYKGKEYPIVFNLNVMEKIQEEYGTLQKWGEMADGRGTGEPNAKAVIFGYVVMLNEGIDIENEENGTSIPYFTARQVGRFVMESGLREATAKMNDLVIESTKDETKNG